MNGQGYKVCPACGQPAVLNMAVCGRCGHRYEGATTQITATRRDVARALGSPKRGATALFIIGFILLSACVGTGIILVAAGRQMPGSKAGLPNLLGAAISTDQIDQRLTRASAHMKAELDISLAWNSLTDLDLQVKEPGGDLITARHRRSASGGEQDVDANPTPMTLEGQLRDEAGQPPGQETVLPIPELLIDMDTGFGSPEGNGRLEELLSSGERAPPRYTHAPVEHTFFNRAPRGTYTVYASCYCWREPNASPLAFTILVRSHGKVLVQRAGLIGPANWVADGAQPVQVCQFTLP